MELTLTTPALLFPAISLLLLAYTNRFLTLANLIRELHRSYKSNPEEIIFAQILNLRYRVKLIRNMQIFGVGSFFGCVLCMFVHLRRVPDRGILHFRRQPAGLDGVAGAFFARGAGVGGRVERPPERYRDPPEIGSRLAFRLWRAVE